MAKKVTEQPKLDAKAAIGALEYLLALGFVSKRRLYFENFMRGVFFSVGSVLGATVVIALILWVLSLFSQVPLVGHFVQNVQHTIDVSAQK